MIPLETSKQYFVLVCWLLSLTTISIGQSKCISNITDQDDSTLLMFKYYKTNEEDKNKVTIQIDGITYTKKNNLIARTGCVSPVIYHVYVLPKMKIYINSKCHHREYVAILKITKDINFMKKKDKMKCLCITQTMLLILHIVCVSFLEKKLHHFQKINTLFFTNLTYIADLFTRLVIKVLDL